MLTQQILNLIRLHGRQNQPGAIVLVEQAVDEYVDTFMDRSERVVALDILLRDLARLRTADSALGPIVGRIEHYVDILQRELVG